MQGLETMTIKFNKLAPRFGVELVENRVFVNGMFREDGIEKRGR